MIRWLLDFVGEIIKNSMRFPNYISLPRLHNNLRTGRTKDLHLLFVSNENHDGKHARTLFLVNLNDSFLAIVSPEPVLVMHTGVPYLSQTNGARRQHTS
jgi:hypothetical protein